ncbi:MAG: cobyrinate a,c-diamide synthase [Gammaproteobacteria bacterium]|nr:cobyrinate a,c-diamide synthase [Gammaproteobacteria bacterium]
MSRFYIAAAHKSSGKTTTSIGLTAALTNLGHKVQTFKKGPDYIDPLWLAKASDLPCYNLDFNTHSHIEISTLFSNNASNADISIIEGNKGLYDGLDLKGSDSNAAMSKLLNTPVILTIDTIGITRGIAPLLLGYHNFDNDVKIAGVILNKVGGSRHEQKLRAAVEHYTDIPVLGIIGYDKELEIPERHLGLVPANESSVAEKVIKKLSEALSSGVDLQKLLQITSGQYNPEISPTKIKSSIKSDIKIAIAKDTAFGFYYTDDLEAFNRAGAELVPFDCINDQRLPDVDGLFIGGGFPETQMDKLAANTSLRNDIRDKINNGIPAYAECGGLMYLSKSISWHNNTHPMIGVIPGDITVHKRPQGRGYVQLQKNREMLWLDDNSENIKSNEKFIPAHEFHYASLDNMPDNQQYAYTIKRGTGITGMDDGLQINNIITSFTHQRNSETNPWVEQFVAFVRKCKSSKQQSEFSDA